VPTTKSNGTLALTIRTYARAGVSRRKKPTIARTLGFMTCLLGAVLRKLLTRPTLLRKLKISNAEEMKRG
jgi:hypothetical protein